MLYSNNRRIINSSRKKISMKKSKKSFSSKRSKKKIVSEDILDSELPFYYSKHPILVKKIYRLNENIKIHECAINGNLTVESKNKFRDIIEDMILEKMKLLRQLASR